MFIGKSPEERELAGEEIGRSPFKKAWKGIRTGAKATWNWAAAKGHGQPNIQTRTVMNLYPNAKIKQVKYDSKTLQWHFHATLPNGEKHLVKVQKRRKTKAPKIVSDIQI